MTGELYDRIGVSYTRTRAEDPRLAARIHAALGAARTVVSVGAGAGSYEPRDRSVTAVEPSAAMRAQRPPGAAPAVAAGAEALPFGDASFDAAMAVLSDHHWADRLGGLRELARVARERVVVFTFDPAHHASSWLARDYLPTVERWTREHTLGLDRLVDALGGARIETVPIPHDCRDGFFHAYWRRPEAYLDPAVRDGISVFHRLDAAEVRRGMDQLARDLADGTWARRNAALLELGQLDLGYRLLVCERMAATSAVSSAPLGTTASAPAVSAGESTEPAKPE